MSREEIHCHFSSFKQLPCCNELTLTVFDVSRDVFRGDAGLAGLFVAERLFTGLAAFFLL